MDKKTVTAIIILMVITLSGLIFIQVYWIRQAVALQEQKFEENVSEALLAVSKKMEQNDALNLMNNPALAGGFNTGIRLNTAAFDNSVWTTQFPSPIPQKQTIEITTDEWVSLDEEEKEHKISLSNGLMIASNTSAPIVNLHTDTVISVVTDEKTGRQFYQSEINFQIDHDTVKRINIIRPDKNTLVKEVHEQLDNFHLRRDWMNEVLLQFYAGGRSIHERLDEESLISFIDQEFTDRGIKLPYEYAVMTDYGKVITKSKGRLSSESEELHRVSLFPNDLFAEKNNLVLFFPDQEKYLLSGLGLMSFSSMALILLVTLCFAYVVFVVFRQKKLSDMKTDFINNMTHELKTPVATISLASEMLKNDSVVQDKNKMLRFANIIHDENKRLGGQVEKVLQMAVMDKGDLKLNVGRVGVNDVVRELVDKFSLKVGEQGGTINTLLDSGDPVISADEMHFTNIITNLLDNAIKYSRDAIDVSVQTLSNASGVTISIADKGIGMGRDQQKRIFEKFYRVPTGNRHDVKGFGLGLSYVKAMVDAHEGSIKLKSEPGKGSTFEVFMPYQINKHGYNEN